MHFKYHQEVPSAELWLEKKDYRSMENFTQRKTKVDVSFACTFLS